MSLHTGDALSEGKAYARRGGRSPFACGRNRWITGSAGEGLKERIADMRPWDRKYQFMETSMQRKAAGLTEKIPDIQKTLDTVRFLKTRTVRTWSL